MWKSLGLREKDETTDQNAAWCRSWQKKCSQPTISHAYKCSSTSKRVRAHKSKQKTLRLDTYSKSWNMFAPPARAKRQQWKIALNRVLSTREIGRARKIVRVEVLAEINCSAWKALSQRYVQRTRFSNVVRFFVSQKQTNRCTLQNFGIDMKNRWVSRLKCCTIFNKIFQRANLSTFENQKIAPHCWIATGVCWPLTRILTY